MYLSLTLYNCIDTFVTTDEFICNKETWFGIKHVVIVLRALALWQDIDHASTHDSLVIKGCSEIM